MDNRLILAVLLVTLSWFSLGTNAQSTTTTTMAATTTTMAATTTTMAATTTTMAATTTTTMAATTTTMASNMTTMASNETTTMASNETTTMATTTVAPLVPNTNVSTLTTAISSQGCSTEKLCVSEPDGCDPNTTTSCFFISSKSQTRSNFMFELAGESSGYLAGTVSSDSSLEGNDTTYVCANDNGTVKFFTTVLDNGELTVTELPANDVKAKVVGNQIQCTFAATVSLTSTRATSATLAVSTGTFNASNNALGAPVTQLSRTVSDLANPNATTTDNLNTTTTAPATTAHGVAIHQSLTQVLLMTVGLLGLAAL